MSDLTPVDIEAKLRAIVNEVYAAQKELRRAREAEVDAEYDYRVAKLHAADSAPRPERGRVTVAERDEHIEANSIDSWKLFREATVAREVAQDQVRALQVAASAVQTLSASVRQAFSLAGVS